MCAHACIFSSIFLGPLLASSSALIKYFKGGKGDDESQELVRELVGKVNSESAWWVGVGQVCEFGLL